MHVHQSHQMLAQLHADMLIRQHTGCATQWSRPGFCKATSWIPQTVFESWCCWCCGVVVTLAGLLHATGREWAPGPRHHRCTAQLDIKTGLLYVRVDQRSIAMWTCCLSVTPHAACWLLTGCQGTGICTGVPSAHDWQGMAFM